jgi:hypothetical protein
MNEQMPQDQRVEHVKDRLQEDLVDEQGRPASAEDVARAVAAAAEPLVDARVQEFTPLLIEHQARELLREQGFHRDLPDADEAASHAPPDQDSATATARDAPHLQTQQGLVAPDHG